MKVETFSFIEKKKRIRKEGLVSISGFLVFGYRVGEKL